MFIPVYQCPKDGAIICSICTAIVVSTVGRRHFDLVVEIGLRLVRVRSALAEASEYGTWMLRIQLRSHIIESRAELAPQFCRVIRYNAPGVSKSPGVKMCEKID